MHFRINITPQKFLFYGFAAVLVLRLCMVFTMGMMPQDAYYFFYSQHLSLSYFDHPPGVAVMLWLFSKVLGTQVWGLKLTDFLVTAITLYVLYRFAGRFLQETRSRNVLFIFGSTLIVTDVSIVATPDVPLLLFWTLSLLVLHHALWRPGFVQWMMAGFLAGLAFDCKYTALFLPIGMIGYLLLSKQHFKFLISWRPLVYLLAFAIAILPVVFWNVQQDFASFHFQSGDRVASMLEFKLRPFYFIATIGHQMLLLLPTLAIAIGVLFWKHLRKAWKNRARPEADTLFLLVFSLPLIIGFLSIAWIYWVKINWMIPAYITASVFAIRYMRMCWMKWQMGMAVVANLFLLIQIAFYPINLQSDDTYWGWEKLAEEVVKLKTQYPDHFLFAADGYKTTALLNYYLDETIYAANVIGQHALEYSITDHDLAHLHGRNALFLDSRRMVKNFGTAYQPPEALERYFEDIDVLPPITLKNRYGKPLRQFAVVECKGYRAQE